MKRTGKSNHVPGQVARSRAGSPLAKGTCKPCASTKGPTMAKAKTAAPKAPPAHLPAKSDAAWKIVGYAVKQRETFNPLYYVRLATARKIATLVGGSVHAVKQLHKRSGGDDLRTIPTIESAAFTPAPKSKRKK